MANLISSLIKHMSISIGIDVTTSVTRSNSDSIYITLLSDSKLSQKPLSGDKRGMLSESIVSINVSSNRYERLADIESRINAELDELINFDDGEIKILLSEKIARNGGYINDQRLHTAAIDFRIIHKNSTI